MVQCVAESFTARDSPPTTPERWVISLIRSPGKDPVGLQSAEALTTVTGKEYNIPLNN